MAVDFAILAPVPRIHLEDAPGIASLTGYVSFGSQKYELFRDVDKQRRDQDVPVLLYASHNEDLAEWGYVVAWQGKDMGSTEDPLEKRQDEKLGHRPPSTARFAANGDTAAGWAVFWRVRELVQLQENERRELRDFQSFRTGKDDENTAPRGPEVSVRPHRI